MTDNINYAMYLKRNAMWAVLELIQTNYVSLICSLKGDGEDSFVGNGFYIQQHPPHCVIH